VSIYKDYAAVYDQSGQLAFSLKMIPYLRRLLEQHPLEMETGAPLVWLDLACGTGTVAVAWAEAGWHVYAIDASAEMLAQARAKAEAIANEPARPVFSQQDMRRFVIPARVQVATCLYDSLNYMLTSEDLVAVFRRVAEALQPGGLFFFDMNTAWALAELWDEETFFTDSDDLAVVFQSTYDPMRQQVSVLVTCFQQTAEEHEGRPCYHKIVERHTEQAYPDEQIATLLADAGLKVEAAYECFSLKGPTATTPRIMWVARKNM
jgi:ubiquinone/menaquinone biosynthesis C-methylase UbiE